MASLTVVGVFDNASEAQTAVEALVNDGFSRSSIDLSTQSANSGTTGTNDGSIVPDRHHNTSGTYAEEAVDNTKDVGSSIGNFFSSLFGDGNEANTHARVADRSSLVTVHAQSHDEAERAADILDENGAVDVDERASTHNMAGDNMTGNNMATTPGAAITGNYTGVTGDQTIKVIEENIQVGKREVETGGVRVRSRIVDRPVEESLRLREERVTVQRNPVNRVATDADLTAFQEGQIEMRETAERAVVSKTANVVEEISIGKEVNERDEVIRDTVRKTEVDVENLASTEQSVRTERSGMMDTDTTYPAR